MVLTDKKILLSRYFSRLTRESLCTAQVFLFTCLNFDDDYRASDPKTDSKGLIY